MARRKEQASYETSLAQLPVATIGVTMKFEWDESKNLVNIRKHGLDLADAEEIFRGVLVLTPILARITEKIAGWVSV